MAGAGVGDGIASPSRLVVHRGTKRTRRRREGMKGLDHAAMVKSPASSCTKSAAKNTEFPFPFVGFPIAKH